jgi:hypothetical protein
MQNGSQETIHENIGDKVLAASKQVWETPELYSISIEATESGACMSIFESSICDIHS